MVGPALRRLKEETRELHLLAEQYVRILDVDATVDDYIRYLRAMHGFHAPVEALLATSMALEHVGFDAEVRRRAHLLTQDLRALGDDVPALGCRVLPDGSSLARLLGIAYVLEGSTLGGRYILAKLPAALAPVHPEATAFLTGYGSDTGTRWREFSELTETALVEREDADAAVAAACDTFRRLTDWLALHEQRDERRGRAA